MTDTPNSPADAAPSGAPKPQPKAPPETLVLRASPRRVVRFKRGVIIGGAAIGAIAIAGAAWLSLGQKMPRVVEAPDDGKAVSEHRPTADAVANLPADYSKVTPSTPILGPPLPGDLGRAIVDRQRELGRGGASADAAGGAGRNPTHEEQAEDAERQRIAAQAAQAREAGIMAQSSARPTAPSDGAAAAPSSPASAGNGATDSGKLSLDLERDQNNQQRKLDFLAQKAPGGIYNPHSLEAPASPYQVMAGSVIAASLITGLNSDLPGLVIAQVTENVYDTATGRFLLIPQGSRLIGSYDSVVAFGQRRALLVWQRIVLPDGASIEIDNLPATDAAGYAGLSDEVDFHTWQLLKGVMLSTLLGVSTQLSLSGDSDLIRAIRESTQQSAAQAGQQIVGKSLNIQPTLTVRPGWPLRVIVHKDLILRPWSGAR